MQDSQGVRVLTLMNSADRERAISGSVPSLPPQVVLRICGALWGAAVTSVLMFVTAVPLSSSAACVIAAAGALEGIYLCYGPRKR